MADRLQRILARQKEREQQMRERDLQKQPQPKKSFEEISVEAEKMKWQRQGHSWITPTNQFSRTEENKQPKTAMDELEKVVGERRWARNAYGWAQKDESPTKPSLFSASKESHTYDTPTTYTFLPSKEYELLELSQSLSRERDYKVACALLEALVVQYYPTTSLSAQNKMYRDIERAYELLRNQCFQDAPNLQAALELFKAAIRAVTLVVKQYSLSNATKQGTGLAEEEAAKWPCEFCTYPWNSSNKSVCELCNTKKLENNDKSTHESKDDEDQRKKELVISGTLARLKRENEEEEERERKKGERKELNEDVKWNDWNFWRIEANSGHLEDLKEEQELLEEQGVKDRVNTITDEKGVYKVEEEIVSNEETEKEHHREVIRKQNNKGTKQNKGIHAERLSTLVSMHINTQQQLNQLYSTLKGDDTNHFAELPNELVAYIFCFFLDNFQDMVTVSRVCKQWHEVSSDDHVYKELMKKHFNVSYRSHLSNSRLAQDKGWKRLYLTKLLSTPLQGVDGWGVFRCGYCSCIWWGYRGWCGGCLKAYPRPFSYSDISRLLVSKWDARVSATSTRKNKRR